MNRLRQPILLIFALPLALLSIGIVGIQLIGASSDAAYGIQLLLFSSLVGALCVGASNLRLSLILGCAAGVAAIGAMMPFEVFVLMLQPQPEPGSIVLPGEAYPDAQGTIRYWPAVLSLFLVHGMLVLGASLLVRSAMAPVAVERSPVP